MKSIQVMKKLIQDSKMNTIIERCTSKYYDKKYRNNLNCKNTSGYCYKMRIGKSDFVDYCHCNIFSGLVQRSKIVLAGLPEECKNL